MTANSITRTLDIAAPRAQVWAALTEPDQLPRWLVPNLPQARLTRDDSGKMQIYLFGDLGVDFVQWENVEPGRVARSRSLPDDLLTVTYALDDTAGGTRVTVTLGGFEALPAAARADRQHQTGAAWEQALANLGAHVAGAPLPHPTAYVGPLFGFWREPNQRLAIERSIWIKAPITRVWQALVDPVQFQAWFSPNTPWELTELAVGGRLFVRNAETGAEQYPSIIELLDPPVQLIYRNLAHEYNPSEKTTAYNLAEENGGTRLTILYTGYEQDDAAGRWPSMEQSTFGYGMMLQNIKASVEGQPLPFPGGF
jgi:uncharacterized protein YndB with AHSA1/START domain